MKHYQPFGCKAYLHSTKLTGCKDHKGCAKLGISVGIDEQIYLRYNFYRPLYVNYVETIHCRFADWIRQSILEEMFINGSLPLTTTGNLEDFQYLQNTY